MFVFGALLVMAGGGGGGLAHGADCYNAPHHGEPYGESGDDKCAFGGTPVVSNQCKYNTDTTDDAQVYHHGPTRG